jgi:ABC-2 type transport system ATP-binding protein
MSNNEIAVSVREVSKSFRLPHEQTSGIKQLIVNFFKRKKGYENQHVLKDISFDIKKGEFFGIVGRNGSGKSTLLKLLAGIYSPDKGMIQIIGTLTPFIELGVGFNPELTGRENVYMNGALLGFNHSEMDLMYDSIVKFAELEKFMDQKLKNYSSGMQVRLAFSIAIQSKSDILLFDEVLAVGDEAFQRKCLDVFEKYKKQNQSIIIVTHDMEIVKRFCDRALLLDKGKIKSIGKPIDVAEAYRELNQGKIGEGVDNDNSLSNDNDIDIKIYDKNLKPKTVFATGDKMIVELSWSNNDNVKNAGVSIIKNTGENIFGSNTIRSDVKPLDNKIRFEVSLDLGSDRYHIMAGIFGETSNEVIKIVSSGPNFIVHRLVKDNNIGVADLEYKWLSF